MLQARSEAEARKPGLQHYMGLDARNPDFLLANNKGTDQPALTRSLISTFVIRSLKINVTRSDIC